MKNRPLIAVGLLLITLFFIKFIVLDKGSFEELILSKLENYDFSIVDITYLETVNYSRDNFENISKLLDYLKTLELEEVVFSPKLNNEPYHIRITGYEGLKRGSIYVVVNNQRYINVYIVKNDKNKFSTILSKDYKITNKDFDYNLLNEIIDNMPIPK